MVLVDRILNWYMYGEDFRMEMVSSHNACLFSLRWTRGMMDYAKAHCDRFCYNAGFMNIFESYEKKNFRPYSQCSEEFWKSSCTYKKVRRRNILEK